MSFFKQTAIKDAQTSDQVHVSESHVLTTGTPTKLTGGKFSTGSTLDPNFWTTSLVGTGAVSQSAGRVAITTGATANSTAQLQSVRVSRHIANTENTFRSLVMMGDTGTTNNTRNWGVFDANNGFFFQLTGTTLNVVYRSGGSDTAVPKASWNVNSTFTLDTNYHLYEIEYTEVQVKFYVDDNLVHQSDISGGTLTSSVLTQNFNLFITLQNNNSGGSTSNVSMTCSSATTFRIGNLSSEGRYFHGTTAATTVLKYSAGRLHSVTFNGTGGTLITLYDNTAGSGTIIASISVPNGASPSTLSYNLPFNTGLTCVSTGTWDFTIVYE